MYNIFARVWTWRRNDLRRMLTFRAITVITVSNHMVFFKPVAVELPWSRSRGQAGDRPAGRKAGVWANSSAQPARCSGTTRRLSGTRRRRRWRGRCGGRPCTWGSGAARRARRRRCSMSRDPRAAGAGDAEPQLGSVLAAADAPAAGPRAPVPCEAGPRLTGVY